ncbi:hypothetical protein EW145_g5206 [Phellinidium pouzarii]|uniref:Mannosyltransferase n=1 Tax=Phellinidium pouzarii TaxID=167371 RepID=A0A4S4L1A3_9AGAM|nr:hypothetical protein EW145_g5206 [Phellinidium pouzarii]
MFPGAVPRSFLGSLILAWTSLPIIHLMRYFDAVSSKADMLISVRLTLATLNAVGLCVLRRTVSKRFGFRTGAFFTALSCSQFHLPFWMGRTLPNTFALFPVNIAYSYLLGRMPNSTRPSQDFIIKAVALLTFTAVIFRAEILLLLGPLVLQALLTRWISFTVVANTGILVASFSILLTVFVDSYFWSKWPLWPELHSLYFNVYQGKSADWGVSPFHTYVTSLLPKLLLSNTPLAALGLLIDGRIRSLLVSPISFIALISCLEHKEWRFIVYTVPIFTVAAARGASWMSVEDFTYYYSSPIECCIAANLLVTFVMTQVSMTNYPGGEALSYFNELFEGTPSVHVHIDNLAAQTGASLFLQVHAPPYPSFLPVPSRSDWVYNKTEHVKAADVTAARHFTHAITEHADEFPRSKWSNVGCVKGFDGIDNAEWARAGRQKQWLGSGNPTSHVDAGYNPYAEALPPLPPPANLTTRKKKKKSAQSLKRTANGMASKCLGANPSAVQPFRTSATGCAEHTSCSRRPSTTSEALQVFTSGRVAWSTIKEA